MKKIILMIVVVTFMINYSNAQKDPVDYRNYPQFGLKAGANYSNVYNAKGEQFVANPKFGLALGLFVSIPIFTYIGIQPEIQISQKGFKATGSILGGSYDFTRTTSYIDIPILFQLKPTGFVTFLVGPQYSYLLKQKDVFANATSSIEQEKEFQNDNIRKNTMCLLVGVDFNLSHLVIGARVGWDVLNNKGDGTSTTPQYKNVWYQATLGYRFYY
jgi:hypothetical protein